MDVRRMRNEALGKRVVKALESRNMEAYYASTKEEAVQKALELMEEGSSVTMGGSMSVRESGLLDAINAGNYEFYDRDQAATPEERQEMELSESKAVIRTENQRRCQKRKRNKNGQHLILLPEECLL